MRWDRKNAVKLDKREREREREGEREREKERERVREVGEGDKRQKRHLFC